MNQKQRNQGNLDLANMLKLFLEETYGGDEPEDSLDEPSSNENIDEEIDIADDQVSIEDIGEMMGTMMLVPEMNFSGIMQDPKFRKVLNETIKGASEMIAGATKVVKNLPANGLTVESGLSVVADTMAKSATRTSSHDFTEYVIHNDKQMALDIMKKMYDGLSGLKVVWLTSFFIEIGWLIEPSSISIMDTFNVKKFSKQLYSTHKSVPIPTADRKAFAACLENYIASYKKQGEQ